MHEPYRPYADVVRIMENAAKILGYRTQEYEMLKYAERELRVSVPVKLDNGEVRVFEGCRIQHSTTRGPAFGGMRYHMNVSAERIRALAARMTFQCAVVNIPWGGGAGGILLNPAELSKEELSRLTRRFTSMIAPIIGPETDICCPDVGTDAEVMSWMMDTYSMIKGHSIPAVVTGKPVELGGSSGRVEADGRGLLYCTVQMLGKRGMQRRGGTVAVQGMGDMGGNAARLLWEEGFLVVAVSDISGGVYCREGLNIPEILAFLNVKGNFLSSYEAVGVTHVTNAELLQLGVDVLIPAALENQITAANAHKVRAQIIVEGAGGAVTSEADEVLEQMGVTLVPDILAGSGGAIVSYFEWMQNQQSQYWESEEVSSRLWRQLTAAFETVWQTAQTYHTTLRTGAYLVAVRRVIEAKKLRGIWP